MREIKFRAWNYVSKEMYYPENPGSVFQWQHEGQVQNIMQYTGLKDKNGKEIYEGDILKHPEAVEPETAGWQVKWGRVGYRAKSLFNENGGGYESALTNYFTETEIIGNIYENPDLLK